MAIIKCANGKWRIGSGKCSYGTEALAEQAYQKASTISTKELALILPGNTDRRWNSMQRGGEVHVFLNDLQKQELKYEERDGRYGIKGLPVLRSGTWKGIDFDEVRLAEIANSFAAIKEADDWMPPVRPRHPTQAEWEGETWDTTQNLGIVEDLQYDTEADLLRADIEVDGPTFEKMRGGNVRYTSAEFITYKSPNTGAIYEDAFRGVAFVDNPAVKNINWALALNADEFVEVLSTLSMGDLSAGDLNRALGEAAGNLSAYLVSEGDLGPWISEVFEGHCIVDFSGKSYQHDYSVDGTVVTLQETGLEVVQSWVAADPVMISTQTATRKGGELTMKASEFLGKIKAALGLTDEQTEKLAVLEAADGDVELDPDASPEPDTPGMTPDDISPEVAEQLSAADVRITAAEKEATESKKLLQAEISKRRDTERIQLLDTLSEEKVLTPAARALVEPVLRVLDATSDAVITLKDAEGEVVIEATPAELLVDALRANADINALYFTSAAVPAPSDEKGDPWSEDNYQRPGEKKPEAIPE